MIATATMEDMTGSLPGVELAVDQDDLRLLAEIGLSAAMRGLGEVARPIFDALQIVRPGDPLAMVGRALGDLSAGRPGDAITRLRAAGVTCQAGPHELQAVLLIAFCLAGHQVDAALLCRRLLDDGRGSSRSIARRLKPVIDAGLPGPGSIDSPGAR